MKVAVLFVVILLIFGTFTTFSRFGILAPTISRRDHLIHSEGLAAVAPLRPSLRFQWTNLTMYSQLAKKIHAHQHNCSIPVAAHQFRSAKKEKRNYTQNWGLGSELHVWGVYLLNAWSKGVRMRTTPSADWAWWDQETCNGTASSSLLACYFPNAETSNCSNEIFTNKVKIHPEKECGAQVGKSASSERVAMTEYLFSSVSPLLIEEATRQLNSVFPNGAVPENLITVHVRWGDKAEETELQPIKAYIDAVKKVVKSKKITTVNLLLCTEDPKAVEAFTSQMPKEWNVYLDQFYVYMLPYRPKESAMNVVGDVSMELLKGKAGLWALGSLLVAMEANIFVLTSRSNWSRLMNELRKGVLEPRCRNCTTMIDLHKFEC